jgi:hypothetical protein
MHFRPAKKLSEYAMKPAIMHSGSTSNLHIRILHNFGILPLEAGFFFGFRGSKLFLALMLLEFVMCQT